MENLFFDNWDSLFRTFIITILGYLAMVLLLRVSGKRTLSKMNAFDFIVTIALGSSLATVALNKNITLVEGILVFALFIFLQLIITWLSVRVKSVKKIITSQPSLLLYKGRPLYNVLKKERVNIEEVYLAARQKGISSLSNIDVIILETTGDITIIPQINSIESQTLEDVKF